MVLEFARCGRPALWLPELAVERVRERVRAGGHYIPPDVVRRYWRGLHSLVRYYRPLFDTWSVYDNRGVGSPVLLAAGTSDGKLMIHAHEIWSDFTEMARWH